MRSKVTKAKGRTKAAKTAAVIRRVKVAELYASPARVEMSVNIPEGELHRWWEVEDALSDALVDEYGEIYSSGYGNGIRTLVWEVDTTADAVKARKMIGKWMKRRGAVMGVVV